MPHQGKSVQAVIALALLSLPAAAAVTAPALAQQALRGGEDLAIDADEERGEETEEDDGALRGSIEARAGEEGASDNDSEAESEPGDDLRDDPEAADGRERRESDEREPRTRRAAIREEPEPAPYEALGVRMGSFLLFPEIRAETEFTDNVFLSPNNREADEALVLSPRLDFRSQWSRHALSGSIGGVRSYHREFQTEDDETFNAALRGRLDIRRNTNVAAEASFLQALEERSSNEFPENAAERPQFRNLLGAVEGNHTFNRVTVTLRGAIEQEDFDDARLSDGTIENNDDRDFTERRLTGRVSYEFQPGVAAFAQASANTRDFRQRTDDEGNLSGSSGHDWQVGASFLLGGKLTGEISGGYARQTPDDPALSDVDGPILNAGLVWQATGLTTVRFDARSEVSETTLTGSGGSLVRAAELSVEHALRRDIILGASLGYEVEEFTGAGPEENEWRYGLTGEYLFTRSLALTANYNHTDFESTEPDSDYKVNEVLVGLRLRR